MNHEKWKFTQPFFVVYFAIKSDIRCYLGAKNMAESVIQNVMAKPQQTVVTIGSGIGLWIVWKLANWFLRRKR